MRTGLIASLICDNEGKEKTSTAAPTRKQSRKSPLSQKRNKTGENTILKANLNKELPYEGREKGKSDDKHSSKTSVTPVLWQPPCSGHCLTEHCLTALSLCTAPTCGRAGVFLSNPSKQDHGAYSFYSLCMRVPSI